MSNAPVVPQVFYLKQRDTLPVLDVILYPPGKAPGQDPAYPDGLPFDLLGTSSWKLHIRLSSGVRLIRSMTKVPPDSDGHLRYAWVATDWDAASSADTDGSYQTGGLVIGPTLPLLPNVREHRMDYEVIGPGNARLTFPNGGETPEEAYDVLRIWSDIGQG